VIRPPFLLIALAAAPLALEAQKPAPLPHTPIALADAGRLRDSLRSGPDFSKVISAYKRQASRDTMNAEAWDRLGLGYLGRMQHRRGEPLNMGPRLGFGDLENAIDAFKRALAVDPSLAAAAVHLAESAEAYRDTSILKSTLPFLRRADSAALGADTSVSLWRARIEREYGDRDLAAASAERYLAHGGSPALGSLELARTLFAMARNDSARDARADSLYFAAVAARDSIASAVVRYDLSLIAPDSVMAAFDASSGESRATLVRRFWRWRDNQELRADGSRLREHYRRLAHVRRHYRIAAVRRYYVPGFSAYYAPFSEFDDRGTIYLRHGPPRRSINAPMFGLNPNESWRYDEADGYRLFHFSTGGHRNYGGDIQDYQLVTSVLNLKGAQDTPLEVWVGSRLEFSDLYQCILSCGPLRAARAALEERRIGTASIAVGTTTDSYVRRYPHMIPAGVQPFAVGQSAGGSVAHLVFAVPTAELRALGARGLRLRFRAFAEDERIAADVDTLVNWRAPEGEEKRWLLARLPVPVASGRWRYAVALELDDTTGASLQSGMLDIPVTDGSVLALSDLVVGSAGEGLPWIAAPGDTAYFSPFPLHRRSAPLHAYYELYGATRGADYRTELTLSRLRSDGDGETGHRVRVTFAEPALEPVVRSRRSLDTRRLAEATYRLDVRVTDPQGRTVQRSRTLRIVKD